MFFSTFNAARDLQDLSGKIVVVTGANQGIGFATVKHLARKGGKIYLGARSKEKGREAVSKLQAEGIAPGEVVYFPCDLSTPATTKESAVGFLRLEIRLDILINNAGCIFDYENKPGQDGITETMMVNHFGTFLFTATLLPLLKETSKLPDSDVRIVTVASERHRHALTKNEGKDAFKTLDICTNFYSADAMPTLSRYSLSKLANILFSNALQRKLHGTNIICLAIHPGIVNTTFSNHLPLAVVFRFLCGLLFKSPDVGAHTSCWAAASPLVRAAADVYGGTYIAPVGVLCEPADVAKDVQIQDDLWEMTVRYLESCDLELNATA